MSSYRSRNKAMVPLVTLMVCLEAMAASKTNAKAIRNPRMPGAGISDFDQSAGTVPSADEPNRRVRSLPADQLVAICGIIAGDYMAEPRSYVGQSSDRKGRS